MSMDGQDGVLIDTPRGGHVEMSPPPFTQLAATESSVLMKNRSSIASRRLAAAAFVSLTALVAASTVQAAVVTWGAETDIAADTDVSTNGTVVMAYNFGDTSVAGTTINGVTFDPFPVDDGLSNTYTVGNATLSTADDRNPRGIVTTTSQSLSGTYLTMLNSAVELIADRQYKLTMSGLTVGQEYELQVWVNNSGRGFFGRGDFPTSVSDADGNEVRLYPGDNGIGLGPQGADLPPAPGQFAVGTFTADAATQELFLGSGEISGLVNGFQLRSAAQSAPPVAPIPEPGSALVGLLVLGLCGARLGRRQRPVEAGSR